MMEDQDELSGYKVLNYFFKLRIKEDSNIYLVGIKVWLIISLFLIGLLFWKRKGIKSIRLPKPNGMKVLFRIGKDKKPTF